MKLHKVKLQTLLGTVIQSDSDPTFYKNVHAYIDYIVKIPELYAIIVKSEKEYHTEHQRIWHVKKKTDYEIDYQAALTSRLESLNLFAKDFAFLEARIYMPIEEYINPSPEFADRLDPVALLMLKGFKATERMGLWRTEYLKIYYRWFDGKRPEYERDLKSFHNDFLKELEKIEPEETESEMKPKIPLDFDPHTGDFAYYNVHGTLSPDHQEYKIFSSLLRGRKYQATHLSMYQALCPTATEVHKTHKYALAQIIRNLKKAFGILPKSKTSNPDIFKSIPNKGYRLIFS